MLWIKAMQWLAKVNPSDLPTQLNIQDVIDMFLTAIGGQ
ncbi:hypothetical protein N007_05250 [Alicyclobacillus acidoterrestris ATCC 49025]|nr:hypothetical protein N007_05250 [Alicyclobacillus acidoterrestris ATCC 49025]